MEESQRARLSILVCLTVTNLVDTDNSSTIFVAQSPELCTKRPEQLCPLSRLTSSEFNTEQSSQGIDDDQFDRLLTQQRGEFVLKLNTER